MYYLGLCELHCAKLHGGVDLDHYIIIQKIKNFSFTDYFETNEEEEEEQMDDFEENQLYLLDDMIECYTENYINFIRQCRNRNPHTIIKNYLQIIQKEDYIKPEIMQQVKLKSGERVAIIKTVWLKIIQRTWKNVFTKRKQILEMRKSISELNYRRIHGKWSLKCLYTPSIYGMLFYLK